MPYNPNCYTCEGAQWICNTCGAPDANCDCDGDDWETVPCPDCNNEDDNE